MMASRCCTWQFLHLEAKQLLPIESESSDPTHIMRDPITLLSYVVRDPVSLISISVLNLSTFCCFPAWFVKAFYKAPLFLCICVVFASLRDVSLSFKVVLCLWVYFVVFLLLCEDFGYSLWSLSVLALTGIGKPSAYICHVSQCWYDSSEGCALLLEKGGISLFHLMGQSFLPCGGSVFMTTALGNTLKC